MQGTDGGRLEVFTCKVPATGCRAPTDQDVNDFAAQRPLSHNLQASVLRPINAANLRQAHAQLESGRTIGKLALAGWR